MIYFLLLIYLFCLVFIYDIFRHEQYKQLHFCLSLIWMILISGLRYRLGRDTPIYMDDFEYYPDIFHLSIDDFIFTRYQPLWIILNTIGRTFHSFAFVQMVVSALHLGIWGYLLNKICPKILFSVLYFYYIFEYIYFNMFIMRESLAVAFFLLSLYSLHKSNYKMMIVYIITATLFHVYAIGIFILFWIHYKFIGDKILPNLLLLLLLTIIILTSQIVFAGLISNFGNSNLIASQTMQKYSESLFYGGHQLNIIGTIFLFVQAFFFILLLYMTSMTYRQYIYLNKRIFASTIWLSSLLLLMQYDMHILYRLSNYFVFFTEILYALYCIQTYYRTKRNYCLLLYIFLIICPTIFAVRSNFKGDPLNPNEKAYSNFFPYSSIFDKRIDKHREHIYDYRY